MKTVLILRHAKAVPKHPNSSDHGRSLDSLGKDDALRVGVMIRDKGMVPCFIISSTALRAKTTAELVAKGCKYEGDLVLDHSHSQFDSNFRSLLMQMIKMKMIVVVLTTINLLLQVVYNLPGCGPFSYENSMFLCYQILCHIYYTDIP